MTDPYDNLLDDLFQGCAFAAYLEQAAACGGWPETDATRRRAYSIYEAALADKTMAAGSSSCETPTPVPRPSQHAPTQVFTTSEDSGTLVASHRKEAL